MANPWITDLNHLLEAEKAAAPRKATRLRGHLTAIVKAATALGARRERETALRCRGTADQTPCPGKLFVRLQDIPSEIHWRCPHCGEKGVILNWPNSPWDLSATGGTLSWGQRAPRCTVLVAENHFHELCTIDFMDPESERTVFSAQPRGGKVALSGSAIVFEDILGELAAEANYESRKARQKRLDRLLQSLNGSPGLNSALAVNEGGSHASEALTSRHEVPLGLPADLAARLQDTLRDWSAGGVRELNLSELAQTLDHTSRGSAGLSPFQLHSLLTADWLSPQAAMQLCDRLPASEIDNCTLLRNLLPFLEASRRAGGIRATCAGNLNRSFVEQMILSLPLAEPWRNEYKQYRKVWNEADFLYLHLLRSLCCLAGLLELRAKRFCLTRLGQQSLQPANRGSLFARLFQAYFQKFDLSALDRLPDNRTLQATIAFSFYALSRQDGSWKPSRLLVSRLLLPAARTVSACSLIDYELRQAESRILGPLADFGLLELRPLESSCAEPSAFKVRKTPLFDRFFQWRL